MDKYDLQTRTKNFALRVIRLANSLPKRTDAYIFQKQIIRSGTSVASNYRAACKSRSKKEFASKLNIVIEEADETAFWLEMIIETNLLKKELVELLLSEANEITAIMVSSRKTTLKQ